MKAVLLVADSAQNGKGKVHALGLGWSAVGFPTPPAALVLLMWVPWDECNKKHHFKVELVDADGHPLRQKPVGGQPARPIQFAGDFEAGRPPGLPAGADVAAQLTVNVGPGLPVKPDQMYEWRLEIDDHHEETWSAKFFIRPAQQRRT